MRMTNPEKMQTLLQLAPVILVRWRADGRILTMSGAAEHCTRLALAPGDNYFEHIHPSDRDAVITRFGELETGRSEASYRLLGESSAMYHIREYSILSNDQAGERDGVLIIEQPEQRLQQQLARCEKELQEFAYIASHDLMEPLRKVQAFGERLQQKYSHDLDEKGQDYLERMLHASARMQEFLNGLLEYSRVNTRGKPPASCDLKLICLEQVERLHKLTTPTEARIAVGDLPVIEADCDQIRQLLQHLLTNALKFHHEGVRPIIAVSAKVEGNQLTMKVKDNGMGFAQEHAEKVFQLFQRLHGRTQYPGAGIGLAVCRRIAERHGGEIRAFATPGSGAEFIVTLPVCHNRGGE
ncbi:hypothetical protein FE236_13095 [Mariprofundus erugo]|nr:hypothetical protein FE236_13095 [Mariprofundus erugo]